MATSPNILENEGPSNKRARTDTDGKLVDFYVYISSPYGSAINHEPLDESNNSHFIY